MSGGFSMRNSFSAGVARAEEEVPRAIEEHVLRTAIEALDYAKQNAPWNDRTGEARDGLDTEVDREGNEIVWTMFHTVDYGQWLETIQNGKFAIIMPTLEMFAPRIGDHLDEATGEDYGG